MKKLKLNLRIVLIDGRVITQARITKSILAHKANKNVTLNEDWYSFVEAECKQPKPTEPPQPGLIGDYLCVGGQWVWFDA